MMPRSIALIIGALCLDAPALAAAQPSSVELAPFTVRQVAPRVHLLATSPDYSGPVVGNVSLVEQSDGWIVVDTGPTAGHGRTIADYIRSISPKPVKAVVITHWHNDHPQGASAIRDAWPDVRIIATEETKKGMLGPALGELVGLEPDAAHLARLHEMNAERQAELDNVLADPAADREQKAQARKQKAEMAAFVASYPGTHMIAPTETFDRELRIDDPESPVRILFLGRANTAGDAIVWLPGQKVVITGDIVVSPTPFGFFSHPSDWVQTLGRIKALDYDLLIPGHGEPQTDTGYLDQLIGSIEDIRGQVGPLARAGQSLEEVRKAVDFSRSVSLFAATDRQKSRFQAYWIDPMVENAWKEARGLPVVQGEGEVTVEQQSEKSRAR